MLVAFRADASNEIGIGHFMRCVTLASELKKKGAKCFFISRNLQPYLEEMLNNLSIEYLHLLPNKKSVNSEDLNHSKWLGVSQIDDAKQTIKALDNINCDWVVVDHYGIDYRWETIIRSKTKKIMVIDDIADRQHDCDVLLDQNFYQNMEKRYLEKVPRHCKLILGPKFALLNEEYRNIRKKTKIRDKGVGKILVFFGGADKNNFTSLAIRTLSEMKVSQKIDVVVGAKHSNLEKIKSLCKYNNFICHIQTSNMASLISNADLAIGAGGSSSWERCCLGLPSIIISLANNQINISKSLELLGAGIYIGNIDKVSLEDLKKALESYIIAPRELKSASKKAFSIVDGLGTIRVIKNLGY